MTDFVPYKAMTEIVTYEALPQHVKAAIESGATRTYCPKCDGGSNREASLTVRPVENAIVKLSCWRSTCSWWALVPTDPAVSFGRRKIKPATYYREEIRRICDSDMLVDLTTGYGLRSDVMSDHGWGVTGDKLVMPVRGPTGGVRGHVTRTFTTPKRVMSYKATAQPWLDHWPGEGHIVIVEDTLSACRLSGLGLYAVALLGTNMTARDAEEIARCGHAYGRRVYIALDNDAFEKSLKLQDRFAHVLTMRPVHLVKDIKNMDDDSDIRRLFC